MTVVIKLWFANPLGCIKYFRTYTDILNANVISKHFAESTYTDVAVLLGLVVLEKMLLFSVGTVFSNSVFEMKSCITFGSLSEQK